MSAELAASMEFSLNDCTFSSGNASEFFKDGNTSDKVTQKRQEDIKAPLCEYPDVLTCIPARADLFQHNTKLLTTAAVLRLSDPI